VVKPLALSVLLGATLWVPISAQCADGSPPPCRQNRTIVSDSLVAVLPFRTVGASLDVYREGLVYLLSADLDGAGGLTTVSPQRAIMLAVRHRVDDPQEAATIARGLGAAIAVTGSLVPTGGGGVRLLVNLGDHGSFALDGSEGNVGGLADSASLLLLSRLTRVPLPRITLASRLPRSVNALRAFLAGERAFVGERFDQADSLYQEALGFDSTFALAEYRRFLLRRIGVVDRPPSMAEAAARAQTMSDRLPERERRLFHASRRGGAYLDSTDLNERLDFVTRYPDDAEGWWWLEDWYFHAGAVYGYPLRTVVEAAEHAIDNHTMFSGAYVHALWAAGRDGDSVAVERLLRDAQRVPGRWLQITRLVVRLRSVAPDSARSLVTVLRDSSPDYLENVALQLSVIDPRVAALRVVEGILALGARPSGERAELLAGAGRLNAARALLDSARRVDPSDSSALLTQALIDMAGLDGGGPDTTIASALRAAAGRWGANGYVPLDLLVLLRPEDSSAVANRARWLAAHAPGTETDSDLVALDSLRIFGRRALTHGDTTTAERLLERATGVATDAVPFVWERVDALDQYLLATVYLARGDTSRAHALLDRPDRGLALGGGVLGLKLLLIADLDAAASDSAGARQHYADVITLWQHGDAAVQPYVQRARTGLARLGHHS
jgi:tetratricopeptide (TPR) repeat protein